MHKAYYTADDVRYWLHNIIRDMTAHNWRPDYIVGIGRGGLIPATMLSHYMNVPMQTLDVSLRDSTVGPTSNCGMAEDAYGNGRVFNRKNILIVDDINDSGATLEWIKNDWPALCMPNDPAWQDIWHSNVRFAVMVNNQASAFKDADYVGTSINKLEKDIWCVFPWEEWWR